jgi:preprotein translocase subunit SecD
MNRTRSSKRRRSGVFPVAGRSAFAHLMPSSTQGSRSTISPGASAKGGFGMGIPAGGGGAAGIGNAVVAGVAPNAPFGPSLPGIAPPAPPVAPPDTGPHPSWPSLPVLPTLPQAPAAGNLGTYPAQIPGAPIPVLPDPTQQVVPWDGATRKWPTRPGGSAIFRAL